MQLLSAIVKEMIRQGCLDGCEREKGGVTFIEVEDSSFSENYEEIIKQMKERIINAYSDIILPSCGGKIMTGNNLLKSGGIFICDNAECPIKEHSAESIWESILFDYE